MAKLENDRFLRALRRQPVDVTPVWIMRQAGRYLPEYRLTREQAGDFLSLCKNPDLACEVTLQPLRRYPLDAAILFSDILTVPDAMGLGLYFETGEGPRFRHKISSMADVNALPELNTDSDLDYVPGAVRTILGALSGKVPLIGFSGSPWTLATYMVEGGSTRSFSRIKAMMFESPEVLEALLERLTDAVIDYLNSQIRAGVHAVQVFDTWGGILSAYHYPQFSLRYLKRIVEGLQPGADGAPVPIILFTKNGGQWLEQIAATGTDAVGIDWTTDIGDARRRVGKQVALQGNLDPATLYASPAVIVEEVKRVLAEFGPGNGHVFNLGHGITPDINPDHLKACIDAVHTYSADFHRN